MSYISTDSTIMEPRFGHAWRAEGGTIHATVKLGPGTAFMTFDSAPGMPALSPPRARRRPRRLTGSRTGASRDRPRSEMVRLAAAGLAAAAGQARHRKVRLASAPADVEMLATLLADYAGSGLDGSSGPRAYPNRRDSGVRVYMSCRSGRAGRTPATRCRCP